MKTDRTYEFSGEHAGYIAIDKVVADIQAAAVLGFPFSVTMEQAMEFRNGGNVNKVPVYRYRVKVGTAEKVIVK